MVYRGQVRNGVVVLEEDARLPEGALVSVEELAEDAGSADEDALYRLGELAVPTGIPDLAVNIDHYLYGHPKAADAQQ